jgi:hypothetical protein
MQRSSWLRHRSRTQAQYNAARCPILLVAVHVYHLRCARCSQLHVLMLHLNKLHLGSRRSIDTHCGEAEDNITAAAAALYGSAEIAVVKGAKAMTAGTVGHEASKGRKRASTSNCGLGRFLELDDKVFFTSLTTCF